MVGQSWLALSDAALAAGINRERLLRLVQGRRVKGRRNLTGRWEIDQQSLSKYLVAQQTQAEALRSAQGKEA
jgi:hypothetical protein